MTSQKEQLLKAIDISDKIIADSVTFDDATKNAFYKHSGLLKSLIVQPNQAKQLNATELKSLIATFLTFWNESIGIDTEYFWIELRRNKIEFERKDPLQFALTKGWFRLVEQAMGARIYWPELKKMKSITERYSHSEIEKIEKLISVDEQKRFELLQKCLTKGSIPQSQYLKFGECMAYFANCNLFNNYFTNEQVEKLYEIWVNFKSS